MKRILVTGSNGLLGQKTVELLSRSKNTLLLVSKEEHSVFDEDAVHYRQIDLTVRQDVRKMIDEFEPEIIVHTAAFTDVDLCEKERSVAWRVNVGSVENIAQAAKLVGARMIHISTDYVFDGTSGPYSETDRPNPISYYGRTKLASENVLRTAGIPCTIIRTMVLYGVAIGVRQNFALWLYHTLKSSKPVRVVDDQIGNPTLADDLAFAIFKVIELEKNGLYHVAGADLMSRFDFAVEIAKFFGFNSKLITPIKTSSLNQPAPRPLKSGFITLKAETELGIKPDGVGHGLLVFRSQLNALGPK